ncbi:MAG: DUF3450 domain-containing protein [Thermodesulfobacteriota bacterium]|nr:DUF3450 domain-containing protein [Thermodesulfobacteriota bacterium]
MKLYLLLCVVMLVFGVGSALAAPFADQVKQPVTQTLEIQQQSQHEADAWDVQRRKLVAELEGLQLQQQQLKHEKSDLNRQVDNSELAIAQLQRAIAESKRITGEMTPFLLETLHRLEQQVETDLPFLHQERQLRLRRLSAALQDSQLAIGEKFRRVMEALRVEAEYGRSVEVTQRTMSIDGRDVLMNQLRLGRLALFGQSLDGQRSVIYDMTGQRWQPLDKQYNSEIDRALEMGSKHRPIDLLTLPLGKVVSQ